MKKAKDPKTASTEISMDIADGAVPQAARVPDGIHCAICLQQGKHVQASTIVKGYACCTRHVDLVAKPNFDIFQLRTNPNFT